VAVFEGIRKTLETAGAALEHVVRIGAFLTSLDDYHEFSQARSEAFGDALPASAAVTVPALLLGARVEVEAVAFVPSA
jgi:2-iminobutanoate/2-iminopropanoate deaminase